MMILSKASRYWWLLGSVILGLFLFTRLVNLTALPIFTDEAIYIRWSQIGSRDANWRFISLTDGKQPMFTWIMMLVLRLVSDPLLAGRSVSVVSGILSLIGIAVLAWEIYRKPAVSVFASLFYLLSPFSLLYDRLALYDSWVAAFFIWNLYLGIRLVRSLRLDVAMILGLTLGAAMLNKTSGFLSLYLLPGTLVLFDWSYKNRWQRLGKWLGLAGVAFILSQLVYSVLRLSPFFHMVGLKNAVFVYPLGEWLTHPWRFFIGNFRGMFGWTEQYLTWPVLAAALLPALIFWRQTREKLLLYGFWLAPFAGLALFGKVLYPRFILFMTMPLLVLAAEFGVTMLTRYRKQVFGLVGALVFFLPSVYIDYFIIFQPKYAPITYSDRSQLIDDWPAGGGVKEVVAFLTAQAADRPIAVFTEGTFGLMPYAIELYLVDHPNVIIKGVWPLPAEMPPEIAAMAADRDTYFVLNQTQLVDLWSSQPVMEIQKGVRSDQKLRLFKILPGVKGL